MPRAGVGVTRRDLGCPGMPMEGVGVPRQGLGAPGQCLQQVGVAAGGHSHISSPGWYCSSGRRCQPPSAVPSAAAAAQRGRTPRSPCTESGVSHRLGTASPGTLGAPPPHCHPRCPQYSHGVEQVGTAVAALEGLWGHGECHCRALHVPQHPSLHVLLPSRCTATSQGTPQGDTCQLGDTEGDMGAPCGSPASPRTPGCGGVWGGCFLLRGNTGHRGNVLISGHHRGSTHHSGDTTGGH